MKYVLRFLMYWIKIVSVFLIISALAIGVFFTAMNLTNCFTLLGDGLKLRAGVVLEKNDPAELVKYFTRDFINQDSTLASLKYMDFVIRDFSHNVEIEWMWNWPWQDTTSVTFVERIERIDGELSKEMMSEQQIRDKVKVPPPAWNSARYKATFKKTEIGWRIDELVFIELVPEKNPSVPTDATPTSTSPAS